MNERNFSKRKSEDKSQESGLSVKRAKTVTDEESWGAGKISKINLQNFMCHSNLSIYFAPRTNFLVGRNGSGKSAILAALTIGLGAKARNTNRCDSIKKLIKNGETTAKIEIHITNCGYEAYKPNIYGDKITIIRNITQNAAGYSIKNALGQTVSKKFDDLQQILMHHNIQVDNPVFILNQDSAREFLRNLEPKKNYKMFLKATQLEYVFEKINDSYEEKKNCEYSLQCLEKKIHQLQKELKTANDKLEQIVSIEDLKKSLETNKLMLTWLHISEQEETITHIQNKKNELELFKSKLKSLLEHKDEQEQKLHNQIEVNNGLIETARNKLSSCNIQCLSTKQKLKDLKANEYSLQSAIQKNENRIFETQKHINEINSYLERDLENNIDEIKSKNLETIKQHTNKQAEIEKLIIEKKEKLTLLNQQKLQKEETINNVMNNIDKLRTNINILNANINNINKKDPLSVYAESIPNIIELKAEIQKRFKAGKFSALPIGPIGMHIRVPNEHLRNLVESLLGNIMKAFMVNSKKDREELEDIIKMKSPNSVISIITTKFIDKVYDVSKGKVEPVKGTSLLLNEIVCDNSTAMNCIIDRRRIECILLSETKEIAEKITSQQQNIPANLLKVIVPKHYLEYFPEPNYRMYSMQRSKARFLQVDVQDCIDQLLLDKRENETRIKALTEELNILRTDLQGLLKDIHNNRFSLQSYETNMLDLQEKISELNNFQYHQQGEVDTLNAEKIKYLNRIKELENDVKCNKEKLENASNEIVSMQNKICEIEDNLKLLQREIDNKTTDNDNLKRQLRKLNELHTNSRAKYDEKNAEILKLEKEKLKLEEEVEKSKNLALEKGERISAILSKDELTMQINELVAKIKFRSTIVQDPDILRKEVKNLTEQLKDYEEKYTGFGKITDMLKTTLKSQRYSIDKLRKSMIMMVKFIFQSLLQTRNFSGALIADIKNETLELLVKPNGDNEVENAVNSTKSLSGGERSYTTVAYLLALWSCVDHPFFFLDEYDVFTDEVNREYITKLLLLASQKNKARQFTFLTPQDTTIEPSDIVAIHRLPEPER